MITKIVTYLTWRNFENIDVTELSTEVKSKQMIMVSNFTVL